MQLEVGFMDCPFHHKFHPIEDFITHSWVRSFWQTLDFFQFKLHVDYSTLQFPYELDKNLTDLFFMRVPT